MGNREGAPTDDSGNGAAPRGDAGDSGPNRGREQADSAGSSGRGGGRRPGSRQEDYTDPSADRGLTSEDLADEAREEAGLARRPRAASSPAAEARPGAAKPRIGDSRPAPASEDNGGSDVS
ncbi:MAG TPA: hypothetical protein VFF40_14645, partial [Acidimicrobiia bacterium]|nr:hypothetical protein [Acidimicrobiia bacterium]